MVVVGGITIAVIYMIPYVHYSIQSSLDYYILPLFICIHFNLMYMFVCMSVTKMSMYCVYICMYIAAYFLAGELLVALLEYAYLDCFIGVVNGYWCICSTVILMKRNFHTLCSHQM